MQKLLLLTLVAYAAADVSHVVRQSGDQDAQVLKQSLDVQPDGPYYWEVETSNGIAAHEHGELKTVDNQQVIFSHGKAHWTDPEGVPVNLQYTADENCYQPQGSHIPTPPPIPEAILRSLEYIRAHPPKDVN